MCSPQNKRSSEFLFWSPHVKPRAHGYDLQDLLLGRTCFVADGRFHIAFLSDLMQEGRTPSPYWFGHKQNKEAPWHTSLTEVTGNNKYNFDPPRTPSVRHCQCAVHHSPQVCAVS
jgi:hypothetical protein